MYEKFFHFTTKPFDLLPNPDLLYMSGSHGKALSYLRYGIEERAGFILLSGEVGSGKTTLIRELIKHHLDNVVLAKIFNTKADSLQLLTMINDDFGLETEGRSKAALLRDLNEFLIDQYAAGKRVVLIIDEAQNLSMELLEEVRMLSNLETDGGKLMQIILVGQPELRQTLRSPELLQLRQRIQIWYHLKPLTVGDVPEYIHYRMRCAGNEDAVDFSVDALNRIHQLTRGIPRLINILCDYLLIDACVRERRDISLADVDEIAQDLDFEAQYWNAQAEPENGNESPVRPSGKKTIRASKVLKHMNELEQRLAVLEREAAMGGSSNALAGFMDRLESVEKQLTFLRDNVESAKAMARNYAASPAPGPNAGREAEAGVAPARRGWFYRLLFGGD